MSKLLLWIILSVCCLNVSYGEPVANSNIDTSNQYYQDWQKQNPHQDAVQQGIQTIEKGNFEEGLYLLRDALDKGDKSPELLFYLAFAYDKQNYDELAEKYYKETLDLLKNNKDRLGKSYALAARTNLAGILLRHENYGDAKDYFLICQNEDPSNTYYYFQLGYLYTCLDHPQDAAKMYQEILKLDPDNARAKKNLEILKIKTPTALEVKATEALLDQPIKVDAQDQRSEGNYTSQDFVMLGKLHEEKGESDKAIDSYKWAIKMDEKNKKAYLALGRLYDRLGYTLEAKELFEIAIHIFSKWSDPYRYLAHMAYKEQNYKSANEYFQKMIQINPKHARAYFFSAICYEFNKENIRYGEGFKKDLAITHYQKAIQLDQSLVEAYFNLGHLYAALDEWKKASDCFFELIKKKPKVAQFHFDFAHALGKNGQLEQAVREYDTALVLKPGWIDVYYNIGVLYLKYSYHEAARDYFVKVIELDSDYTDAYYNLGLLYDQHLGNANLAQKYYRHYLSLCHEDKSKTFVEKRLIELK